MQQELTNFYQFLYHVTPVVIFQVKSWSYSTFYCFVHWDLVSTLLKNNQAFYLAIRKSFPNFPLILLIRSRANPRNRRKILNLEDFSFSFIEVLKLLLWNVR